MGKLVDLSAVRADRALEREAELDREVSEYMRFVAAWRKAYPEVRFIFSTADVDGTGEITEVQLDDEAE